MMLLCNNNSDCEYRSQCQKVCPCSTCDMSYKCITEYIRCEEEKSKPPYILVTANDYVLKESDNDELHEGLRFKTVEELIFHLDLVNLRDKQLAIINISGGTFWLYTIPINEFSETYQDENHDGHLLLCEYLTWKQR